MEVTGFIWDFIGKVGAPTFAATLVACLLSGRFDVLHAGLLEHNLASRACQESGPAAWYKIVDGDAVFRRGAPETAIHDPLHYEEHGKCH